MKHVKCERSSWFFQICIWFGIAGGHDHAWKYVRMIYREHKWHSSIVCVALGIVRNVSIKPYVIGIIFYSFIYLNGESINFCDCKIWKCKYELCCSRCGDDII